MNSCLPDEKARIVSVIETFCKQLFEQKNSTAFGSLITLTFKERLFLLPTTGKKCLIGTVTFYKQLFTTKGSFKGNNR